MDFLRKHWYDLGGGLAIIVLGFVFLNFGGLSNYQLLMWLSLVSLFFHQLEEYRIAGTFPGMVNTAMYQSEQPDRYPLNTNTSLIVNTVLGWLFYFLSAVFAERAVWLGLATMLVSLGNIIAHTILFNFKGRSLYNAGLATCWLLFAPSIYFFYQIAYVGHLIQTGDYLAGIPLGILLNVGILKLIDWLADRNTTYLFEQRNVLKAERK
ncbi:MAG: HXXEE domain-containing protein [Pedobacter sp.]